MEEILSSIKRIIAEENDAPPPVPAARRPRAAPPPADESDVLELTQTIGEPETMQVPEPDEQPGSVEHERISAEEAPAIAAAPVAPFVRTPPVTSTMDTDADALLSKTTEDATRQALASLSRMVIKPEDPVAENTLEGLVRDMLRPMLKDWLDANLPGIVQATVDREVARISGRSS